MDHGGGGQVEVDSDTFGHIAMPGLERRGFLLGRFQKYGSRDQDRC